jgi:hypothetical protein
MSLGFKRFRNAAAVIACIELAFPRSMVEPPKSATFHLVQASMDKLRAETAKSRASLPAREYALRAAEAEVRPATASQDQKRRSNRLFYRARRSTNPSGVRERIVTSMRLRRCAADIR